MSQTEIAYFYEDKRAEKKAMFFRDIAESKLEIVELSPSPLIKSLEICSRQYISPLDALQLASALEMAEKPFFVCSDKKLLRLAAEKGLRTIDPTDP